jgi:hypothetical protein
VKWTNTVRRQPRFQASAFPYDAERDCFTCPAGEILRGLALLHRGNGVRTRVYRAPKTACPHCPLRDQCAPKKARQKCVRSITRPIEPAATTAFKAPDCLDTPAPTNGISVLYREASITRAGIVAGSKATLSSFLQLLWFNVIWKRIPFTNSLLPLPFKYRDLSAKGLKPISRYLVKVMEDLWAAFGLLCLLFWSLLSPLR